MWKRERQVVVLVLKGDEKEALKRARWSNIGAIIIHAPESAVKSHALYERAKMGDAAAAEALVEDCTNLNGVEAVGKVCADGDSLLVAVHALEAHGMNAIPRVFARVLGKLLNLSVTSAIIQSNKVAHTGATGYHRLAFPALFEGPVDRRSYFMVDDFVGQGGTLANLRGYLESNGGEVLGATALTGRADSAVLAATEQSLALLRRKHGGELEKWWTDTFGYSIERLTESEARYLARVDSFNLIRERVVTARGAGNR